MENTKINQGGVYKNGCISPFEEKEQLTFIDFFAGIGGFRRGMELAGHKCVGFCEFDKYATASYTSMHLITEEQKEYLKTLPLKKRQKEILQEEYRNGEWYVSDIRDANVRNLPKADCWCFGAPCFVKGTLITTHRGLIPIEDIHSGDFVLTHKNRFQKVIKPMINVKQGIYTLKVQGSPNTEVTGNHRFYVKDKQKVWNNSLRRYEIIISEPYWKEVQNFNGNELIQFTVNPHDKNIYELTEEECWLIGRYVADGYIRDNNRKDRTSNDQRVIFCIGKGKEKEFENNSPSFDMYVSEERTIKKYITGNKKLFSLCKQCGRGAKNKIIPQFIMDLNPHMLKSFISGYLSGDGSYSNGVWKATSISKTLIYQLGQCISKAYHVGYSIHYTKRPTQCQIEDRMVNQNDTWQIVFRIHPEKSLFYYIDGMLWQPVKKIEFNPIRKEIVYNMEVENDNSYTANNMGVHNCQDFSIAGKRAGLDGDRSSLIREIFRLLEEQKEENRPEWLIYENVKGMLSSNRGLDYLSILSELDRLGYDIEWQNINSKWFVPQNRERIYTIGHLRRFGRRKVLPVTGTDGENCVQQIDQLYGYEKEKNPSGGRVYSEKGICATLESGHGMSQPQVRVVCNTNPSGHGMNGNIYDSQAAAPALTTNKGEGSKISINIIGKINSSQDGLVHSINGISQCQSAGHSNCAKVAIPVIDVTHLDKTQNGRRLKENEDPMFTLTAQDRHGVVIEPIGGIYAFNSEKFGTPIYKDFVPTLKAEKHDTSVVLKTSIKKTNNDGIYAEMPGGFLTYCVWYEKYQCYIAIRKLTPKECFRLQGWSDEYFERASFVNSDSQLYKQAGNGVTVDVVNAIGKQIYLSE